MPIQYRIDRERNVIFETWTGEVAAADLGAYWKHYLEDEEVLALRRTLVDMRGCTILFNGRELAGLVDSIALPVLQGRTWTTALVVDQPVQFGVGRQYNVFAESFSNDAIFQDPGSALDWLTQQH